MDIATGILILFIGIFAGGYGTIVGAGGGFIFVPALLIVLDMEPALAAGTGITIVLINSISGFIGYAKQKKILYKVGLQFGIGAVPGSFIGVWLLQNYSTNSPIYYWVFATLLVSFGFFILFKNSSFNKSSNNLSSSFKNETSEYKNLKLSWLVISGFLIGILSSYLGIGGGWLLVPIFIYLFRLPTSIATATSIFSLCIYSTVGVIFQISYNSVDWAAVLWGGCGVIIGAQIGVQLSKKLSDKIVVQMLSILLLVVGFRMYFS